MENKTTVTWITKDGRAVEVKATVTLELSKSRKIWADGYEIEDNTPHLVDAVEYIAIVAGQTVGTGAPVIASKDGSVYRIGQLGITAGNLDRIKAAVDEARQAIVTPEIAAHIAVVEASRQARDRADEEYAKHTAAMRKIMSR